jgi:RNA polymerase sigma factor (TIGR02999 family)
VRCLHDALAMPELPERYDPEWFAPQVFEEPEAFSTAYRELCSIARYLIRGEAYSPTLQATELVNQAFLKLYTTPIALQDRQHLLAVLSRYMRQILIDRARRKHAVKRAGVRVSLDDAREVEGETDPPWEAVDDQLARLRELDPVLARVFELHYFAGVSLHDLAVHLDKSERTVKRYWRAARAWVSDRVREAAV